MKIAIAITCSLPFLAVRLAYACLSVFVSNPIWSPLNGGVATSLLMLSMMEHIVVLICLVYGFIIQPTRLSTPGESVWRGNRPTVKAEVQPCTDMLEV